MKKQILFTLVACLLSVSLTAADVSVTEKFSTVSQSKSSGIAGSKWTGDVCTWQTQHARRGSNDVIEDNKQATWLTLDATTRGYIRTTNLEGGIKSISFPYAQFGAEANVVLKWQVSAGSIVHTIERDGDLGNNKTSPESYEHVFECKENVQLEILNMSVKDDETQPDEKARLLIGNITITPYLLYRQKEVTIGTKQRGYVNAELIDNTDGDAITYSSSDPTIATVDSQTGVVTPLAAGETTITAAWSEGVTTTYTLRVIDNVIVENFSKVKQTGQLTEEKSWSGDLFGWRGNYVRRGVDDTIGLAPRIQATAMRYNEAGSYLYSANPIEGGIKHVTFDWRQWGKATAPLNMYVYYSTDKENWGTAVAEQTKDAATAGTQYLFDADIDDGTKGNAYLKIQYTSGGAHAVVGAIKITPYLLYTTKEAILDTRYATTYTNTDLINNTTGNPVVYTISDNSIASIDAATGEVTPVQEGEVTITATWGAVTTSYTLQILAQTETEASFAEAIKRVDVKDVVENTLTKTDGYDGTIAYASTNTAVATIAADGALTIVGVGQTTITATLPETTNYKAAAASYNLYVTDKNALVEKFSNVEQTGVVGEDITDFGGDLFAWVAQYQVRRGQNDTIHATAGKHQATSIGIQDPENTPLSSILQSKDVVEGGIKYLSFYWAQWGAGNTTIRRIAVYADNELVGYGELPENSKNGTEALLGISHLMKSNKQLTIKNESYIGSVGSLSSASNSSRIVIDNIHITPYLLYTNKAIQKMSVGETYMRTLDINNTEGEIGTLSYSSSNTDVAEVDESGMVVAKSQGEATITARFKWTDSEDFVATTYKVIVYPAKNCETFVKLTQMCIVAPSAKSCATEPVTDELNNSIQWTYWLGGCNEEIFSREAMYLRARLEKENTYDYGYLKSEPIAGGLSSLTLAWNQGGSETGITYDVEVKVNGNVVGSITTAGQEKKYDEPQIFHVENLNYTGNVVIEIVNKTEYAGEKNKGRFVIDYIQWEGKEGAIELKEDIDNGTILDINEGAISDVQLVRSNLVANVYNTLCLPFAISKSTHLAGADVQEMTSAVLVGNELTIGFTSLAGNELKAGVPYLVKPTAEVVLNTFSDVQIVAAPQAVTQGIVTLQGIFSPTEMIAGDQTTLFVGTPDANGDNLYYPSATANIKGFRAYFKLNLPDGMNAAPARARFVVNQTEVATGVEQVANQAQTTKMLRDGQLIILRDGVEYNAQGARVK